jgi:hypothetical protein
MVADFWDALRGPKRCSKTSRRAIEDAPAERHKPLAQLFDRVWQNNGTIVTRRAPHAVRALLRDRRRHPGPQRNPASRSARRRLRSPRPVKQTPTNEPSGHSVARWRGPRAGAGSTVHSLGRLRTWRRPERRCHLRVRRSAETNLLICRDFSGSDGTRTRDLRRDRPRRPSRRPTTTDNNRLQTVTVSGAARRAAPHGYSARTRDVWATTGPRMPVDARRQRWDSRRPIKARHRRGLDRPVAQEPGPFGPRRLRDVDCCECQRARK